MYEPIQTASNYTFLHLADHNLPRTINPRHTACTSKKELFNNTCIAKCATGATRDPVTGACGEGVAFACGRVTCWQGRHAGAGATMTAPHWRIPLL